MSAESVTEASARHAQVELVSSKRKHVLIVVASPGVSTTLGWPVGFWAAELTHPYYELTERGVEVTIASPDGGKVEFDAYSDPRDPSKWDGDAFVGRQIMPWRVEDALRERGANYIHGGLFKAFAVRDGRLITGQQQYSGRRVAQMVIETLGV
jgi:putative intracellular protease/amidase